MPYIKKLIGERVYLSPRGSSDDEVQTFTQWMNDIRVSDYIQRTNQLITYENEKEFLESSAKSESDKAFGIVCAENNRLIGSASLEQINPIQRNAVLGIFIGDEKFRNKGYGTEAIRLLLEFGFKYLNLHSISLTLLAVNERAHKCYLKCDFKDTGRDRERMFLNGKYYDSLHMDILETEFSGDYIKNKEIQ